MPDQTLLRCIEKDLIEHLLLPLSKGSPPNDIRQPKHRLSLSRMDQLRSFAIFLRVLSFCHTLLITGRIATLRDLYYQDVTLFGNQKTVNHVVHQLALLYKVPRRALSIVASAKGWVAGALQLMDKNNEILYNVEAAGIQGMAIPDMVNVKRMAIASTVRYIVVVEKETVYRHLMQSLDPHEWIIVTGKGYPCQSTCHLVHLLSEQCLHLPLLGLFDGDPFGVHIASVYKFGSKAAHNLTEKALLLAPRLVWIGVRWHSHIQPYLQQCNPNLSTPVPLSKLPELNEMDLRIAKTLKQQLQSMPEAVTWLQDIDQMIHFNCKMELEHLFSRYNQGCLQVLQEWINIK